MSKISLLHQAKQGDSQAIANLLNQSLSFRKTQIVESTLEDNCLQLKLESKKLPNQHKLVSFFKEEINSLNLEIVQKLEVHAFVTGTEEEAWQATVILEESTSRLAELSNMVSTKSEEVDSEEVSLELRAKRGDLGAILQLINGELPKNTTTQIRLCKGYLQVLAVSAHELDKDETVQLIQNKLSEAKLPIIKRVTIYGKQTEEEIPIWHEDFENCSRTEDNNSQEISGNSLFNKLLNFKKN